MRRRRLFQEKWDAVIFNTAGNHNWIVPSDIERIDVFLVGGGATGRAASFQLGGGGGGGVYNNL